MDKNKNKNNKVFKDNHFPDFEESLIIIYFIAVALNVLILIGVI